jgi:hypothetical protein
MVLKRVGNRGESINLQEALHTLTGNHVIQRFLDSDERTDDSNSYRRVLGSLFSLHGPQEGGVPTRHPEIDAMIDGVLSEAISLPEESVRSEGLRILADYNKIEAYARYPKAGSFSELALRETVGEYDLADLFAHTVGVSYAVLQVLRSRPGDPQARERFQRNFRNSVLILRAIDLEARESTAQ